jgi:hypothetical protein
MILSYCHLRKACTGISQLDFDLPHFPFICSLSEKRGKILGYDVWMLNLQAGLLKDLL